MHEVNERIFNSQDWVTIVFILIISLIVFNKLLKPERFYKIQLLLYSDIYISVFSKATALITNVFTYLFIIINSFIITLLLFIAANKLYQKQYPTNDFQLFLTILTSVFIYIILRTLIGYLLGKLFEFDKEQQYISFLKISYLSNFSLLILPLLIIGYYINSKTFYIIILTIATLLMIYYYIKIIKLNQKLIFNGLFYFILYLCALEISPFLIFYKVFIN